MSPGCPNSNAHQPILQVTLVHGTWGRGFFPDKFKTRRSRPRWFDIDGDFAAQLREKLGNHGISCQIRPFLWSGANSITVRDLAARDLAALIRQDPDDQHELIIAHSHGGNVALRSLSYLGKYPKRKTMVVTLATPFLDVVPRQMRDLEEYFLLLTCFAIPVLLWVCAVALLLYFFISFLDLSDFRYRNEWWNIPILGARPYMIFTIFCSMGIGFAALAILGDPFNSKVIGLAEQKFYASSPITDAVSALILRSVDDEPHLIFAIGSLGNRLVATALQVTVFLVIATPSALILYIVSALFADALIGINPNKFLTAMPALLVFAFCVGPLTSIIFILLSGVMRSVFGRELLIGAFRQDVAFDSTPDHQGRISIQTLASAGGLRHSIYNHIGCPAAIAEWVGSVMGLSSNTVESIEPAARL